MVVPVEYPTEVLLIVVDLSVVGLCVADLAVVLLTVEDPTLEVVIGVDPLARAFLVVVSSGVSTFERVYPAEVYLAEVYPAGIYPTEVLDLVSSTQAVVVFAVSFALAAVVLVPSYTGLLV